MSAFRIPNCSVWLTQMLQRNLEKSLSLFEVKFWRGWPIDYYCLKLLGNYYLIIKLIYAHEFVFILSCFAENDPNLSDFGDLFTQSFRGIYLPKVIIINE